MIIGGCHLQNITRHQIIIVGGVSNWIEGHVKALKIEMLTFNHIQHHTCNTFIFLSNFDPILIRII